MKNLVLISLLLFATITVQSQSMVVMRDVISLDKDFMKLVATAREMEKEITVEMEYSLRNSDAVRYEALKTLIKAFRYDFEKYKETTTKHEIVE